VTFRYFRKQLLGTVQMGHVPPYILNTGGAMTDGGLYVGFQATGTQQFNFRQGPNYIDGTINASGRGARVARLTTDLDPWWVARIEPSTEDTLNRTVWINDIVLLDEDGGAIVIGTFASVRNQPAAGPYSMNFYNADNTLAFNIPKKNKAVYGGFFARISPAGVWQWCQQIWDDPTNTGRDAGVQCRKGSLVTGGLVAVAGQAVLLQGLATRLYFDAVTFFNNIVVTTGLTTVYYGYVAFYNVADGTLVAAQVDSPEANNFAPTQVLFHNDSPNSDMNGSGADSDFAPSFYEWGGGLSPYSSEGGVVHSAAKYGFGNAGVDILLDYGNTDLFLPYIREDSNSTTGFLAARDSAGVDWAAVIEEPDPLVDINQKMFSNVWTFPDGSCIALGKSGFKAADDQNADLERYALPLAAPVEVDAEGLPYLFAVRFAANGDVVWSRRIAQYGAVIAGIPVFIAECWDDDANNLLHFIVAQNSSILALSAIDGAGVLYPLNTTGASNKAFLFSLDKDTGAVTHVDRIISQPGTNTFYGYSLAVSGVTGKVYVLPYGGTATTAQVFPSSVAPISLGVTGSSQQAQIVETTVNPSPATPVTNPYTPTRVRELTYLAGGSNYARIIRPIVGPTVYDRAAQYYDFYSRRVTAGGGAIVDAAATLAFIEGMVAEDIWTAFSAAFLPFAGLAKDGGELVSRWFNLHGPDVTASGTLRPTWVASDAGFNNQPVLTFDGATDYFSNVSGTSGDVIYDNIFVQAAQFEAFAVFNADIINTNTNGANDSLIVCSVTGLELNSVPRMQIWNNDGTVDVAASVITTGATYLAHGRHEGGQVISSIDGGVETSAASGNCNPALNTVMRIGANVSGSGLFDGRLAGVFALRRNLTVGQRAAFITYLKNLYGIA